MIRWIARSRQAGFRFNLFRKINAQHRPGGFGLTLVVLLIATTASAAEETRREKFDQACALAAKGKTDEAREIWRDTALDADKQVAGMSHFNLAGLAVEEAHKALGEDPLQAAVEARVKGLEHLAVAAGHYRDGLDVDPELAEARKNLEIVRLWTHYIQDEWRRLDRQKQREGLDLLAYLDLLAEEQRGLQATAKQQAAATASPRRWQTIYEASKSQRRMRDEIQPLKQKIAAALQPAPEANAAAPAAPPTDVERAQRILAELADKSGASMDAAAKQLAAQRPADAVAPQGAAIDGFEKIYLATAPFLGLVQKGIAVEEKLVAQSQAIVKPEAKAEGETPPTPDFADLADRQRFVTDLSKVLPLRAKAELQQMEQASGKPALLEGESQNPAAPPNADPQQAANQKKSLQAALALSPEIERLSREAADDLEKQDAAAALPKQEEALRLLKEILEQQQDQQNEQQDQQQQQDQKQDQNQQQNQDQKSQDQKDQQQKSDDQQKQDQDKKDQDKQDQEKQDQQNESQGEQDQEKEQDKKEGEQKEQDQQKKDQGEEDQKTPQPDEKTAEEREKEQEKAQQQAQPDEKSAGDEKQQAAEAGEQGEKKPLSPDQTAALLQKVRERQQEHRERMKAMEQFLRRSQKVEKDW